MRTLRLAGEAAVQVVAALRPEPKAGEVLVRTVVSAICGTELKSYRGAGQESGNPGHEAAGVIEALGEGVTDRSVGQRVGITAVVGCGECDPCRAGRYTWCPNRTGCGSLHAEYFCAPARVCLPLDDDIPWQAGVLLAGDGFGVPYHTSTKLRAEDIATVAVLGAGPIGLGSVLLQSHLGRRVLAVDVKAYRRQKARDLGGETTVDAAAEGADVAAAIRDWSGGAGADVAIEAAGRPETARQCFAAVRPGGTVVFNGEQGPLELSPSEHFIRRDITAVGSWFYHVREFPEMVSLYRAGLDVTRLISHEFPADQAAEAYATFAAGESAKVLLRWAEDV